MTTAPTPSQTVGPFYGYALPFPDGGSIAPPHHPEARTIHGYVYDGAAAPIPDAMLEFWQAAPDGSRTGAPGSMRRSLTDGGFLGRNGVDFTGFGRVGTDADGHYTVHTLPPGGVPYLSVLVFARGLLHHVHTRVYLPELLPEGGGEPLLDALPPARRRTVLATPEGNRTHRFDVRLQSDGTHEETVFLAFD